MTTSRRKWLKALSLLRKAGIIAPRKTAIDRYVESLSKHPAIPDHDRPLPVCVPSRLCTTYGCTVIYDYIRLLQSIGYPTHLLEPQSKEKPNCTRCPLRCDIQMITTRAMR